MSKPFASSADTFEKADTLEILGDGVYALTAEGDPNVGAAVEQTRKFLNGMIENVGRVHRAKGSLKEAFEATHAGLNPEFGVWPVLEHCLPSDVQRLWDEFDGIENPRIWTAERDREIWAKLQG